MKRQVLSIEQIQHLKELGVDTSKANLFWARRSHGTRINDDSKGEWFVSLQKVFMTCGFALYETIPTFTLQDIIELLPKVVEYNFEKCYFSMKYDEYEDMYAFLYSNGNNYIKYICEYEIMDAAYQMLCWCAENGYLKGGEK